MIEFKNIILSFYFEGKTLKKHATIKFILIQLQKNNKK